MIQIKFRFTPRSYAKSLWRLRGKLGLIVYVETISGSIAVAFYL